MYSVLIMLFVVVCFLLTFVILIQSSKGGGLAGTFGGTDTMSGVFGGRGSAPFLQKITAVLATIFLVVALLMGFLTKGTVSQSSLVQQERERRTSSPTRTLPQVPSAPSPGTPASTPQQ
jgi:preprotein translocase subunit SecG